MIQQLLPNTRILICRPEPSASELSDVLQSVGARCHVFPTLRIQPLAIDAVGRQTLMNLDHYDHVIVTSQHAAEPGLQAIDEYWPQLPIKQSWHAIGRKTAGVLNTTHLNLIAPNQDMTSETLLLDPQLKKTRHKKILILKGKEGRNALQHTLEKRGATVHCLELYERICPSYSPEELQHSLCAFNPDFVIALSGETLTNLIKLSQSAHININHLAFILPSQRVANFAREQGLKFNYVADNLMPMDIIRCITKARKNHTKT